MSDHNISPVKAVVFDFDFTLADSSGPVVECVNYGLRGLGLAEASGDAIKRTIGLHLSDTLVALAGEEQRPNAHRFLELFGERADDVMAENTRIFPGVSEALETLKGCGYRLGIVSTKYRYRIEQILSKAGLLSQFDVIVGGEDVERHKPAPDSLLMALERLRVDHQEVVYVGDSITDARTAQATDVGFVAVLSGTTLAHEFEAFPKLTVLPGVDQGLVQYIVERKSNGNP
ncbi:MAG: HAD-IA family hydrolase [Chloroflexi bacterium]|nr:HAD-IA family hydrolase [Chloroflexota bacterium]